MDLTLPPDCAARFRAEALLASGGQGTVYRATQLTLGRTVAVKVLRLAGDPDLARRFREEARVTAAMSSPHIVKVLDHGADEGIPWIAYELLEGPSLRERLDASGPLAPEEALAAAAHVASALEEAHAHGVVHRDIKPANIIEARPGHFVVTDFGVARWVECSRILTASGVLMGTPAYLAPEVVEGATATPAADIYALGVTLHELLTGRPPFEDANLLLLLERHLMSRPEPPSARRPGLDPALDDLVLRALAKRPEKRFGSAAAFRAALSKVRPPRPREHTAVLARAKRSRLSPRVLAPAGLTAVAVAVAAFALARLAGGPVPAKARVKASAVASPADAVEELERWLAALPPGSVEEGRARLAGLEEVPRPIRTPHWLIAALHARLDAAVTPLGRRMLALEQEELLGGHDAFGALLKDRERSRALIAALRRRSRGGLLDEPIRMAPAALRACDAIGPALLAVDLPATKESDVAWLLASAEDVALVLGTHGAREVAGRVARWTRGRPPTIARHLLDEIRAHRISDHAARLAALRAVLGLACARAAAPAARPDIVHHELAAYYYAQLSDAMRQSRSGPDRCHEVHAEWLAWRARHPVDTDGIRKEAANIEKNCLRCTRRSP